MRRWADRALLAAVVAVAAVTYALTASRYALGGDVGEMDTIAVTGGAAHPPGYPLFATYLHAMRWLPGTPAHAASLANALVAAAAVAVLARASLAWGASRASTALALGAYAFAPIAWGLAVSAEVFALNALFAGLLVGLAAPREAIAPGRRAVLLAFVAGLALANQQTIVALAPVGLHAFGRALKASGRRAWRVAGACAAALLVGLAPYAWLFAVAPRGLAPSTWSWGDVHDLASLVDHVGRREYTNLGLTSFDHVAASTLRVTVAMLGLPALGLGALGVVRVREGRWPSAAWVALSASALLAGPVFALVFHWPLEGIALAVLERFDLLPMALLVPLCARAIDRVGWRWVARPAFAAGATALVIAVGLARGLPDVRARERPGVELYARNALLAAPPDAVVLGTGDARMGAFLYARYALGLRPDVLFVNPRLLPAPWYRARIGRALGAPIVEVKNRVVDVAGLLATLLRTGRPVLVCDLFAPKVLASAPSYPVGPLIRIVPDPSAVPSPDALEAANLALYARMEPEPLPIPGPEPWADALVPDYARPWQALAGAFRAMGDDARARENDARAQAVLDGSWTGLRSPR